EFSERLNTTGAPIDIAGWCIDGISYCFPRPSVIPASGFAVRTGAEYDGALSNGGEELALIDAAGRTVDALEYDDKGTWPAMADGEGPSIQRRDPAADSSSPGNWISATPTPGAHNSGRGSGLMPVFDDVEHTVLPAAGRPVSVTARLTGATGAALIYRIGFGPEVITGTTRVGDVISGTIPGQPAGTLIRYRLQAYAGSASGSWPRQGDGSRYWGTTVARSAVSALPRFEFFMPDDEFRTMAADLTLSGDDGYPMVFAHDGQIFDNAVIRVKGQVSRYFPKKKFKVVLPAGYDWDGGGMFPEDVDEFALHSSWIDRSFLRETLASEFMEAAGLPSSQAFPVRLERNGSFFGLYTYVEQPDGTWRDRWGLDDSEVYEVGPDSIFGMLAPGDAGRSTSSLRARYDKETFEHLDDGRLRSFISTVNALSGTAERDWILANTDVASVVNGLAASMVVQHQDWGHKNYRLVFDQYGRAGITVNDFDLTFGRRWSMTSGPYDTNVYVGGAFEHPGGPFLTTFFTDPELLAMVQRRIRTLTEELLEPTRFRSRVDQLAAAVRPDAVLDRAVWGTYAASADPTTEANRIVDSFVAPQYRRLLGSFAITGRVAANSQPAIPDVVIEDVRHNDVEHVVLRNRSGDSVDLSGFTIPELDVEIAGGTVLLPGRAAILLDEDVTTTAGLYRGFVIAGYLKDVPSEATSGLTLRNRTGSVVARWDRLPPRQTLAFDGEPARSALVGIAAIDGWTGGYLQVLDCASTPGSTSNVNVDGRGQTRAALALTAFDGSGRACLFNSMAAHAIADVQGYFADGAVDDVVDRRLVDTRTTTPVPSRGLLRINGGRPGSTAIVNLTAVDTSAGGYLAVVPCSFTPGSTSATSNLNWPGGGSTVAAPSFVEFDADGGFCVTVSASAHVVADVQGYLADWAFENLPDRRIADTRPSGTPVTATSIRIVGRPGAVGVVSLVAVAPSGNRGGFLRVHACSDTDHTTSNLNYAAGAGDIAGLATVVFDDDGEACIHSSGTTHVVVDLQGYFADGAFDDVDDIRVLDTR
ncbi:MAG: CotH kinase family protein, partial [Ilumatobacteraceae bacterium]